MTEVWQLRVKSLSAESVLATDSTTRSNVITLVTESSNIPRVEVSPNLLSEEVCPLSSLHTTTPVVDRQVKLTKVLGQMVTLEESLVTLCIRLTNGLYNKKIISHAKLSPY